MDQTVNLIIQFGKFAMVVIAVCVAVMLLISFMDRHPRDDRDQKR